MKRSLTVSIALLIATILVLTGCSANANKTTAANATSQIGTAQNNTSDGNQKSSERKNFKRPNLIGEVQNIVGNSVTLALAKMPSRDTTSTQTGQKTQTTGGSNDMPSGPPPGDFQGQGGNASGKTSGTSNGQSTTQRRATTLTLTGETKEILIPVGVTITSGFGKNAKTIDIADIKKGSTLMIYYVEGTENIDHISVR